MNGADILIEGRWVTAGRAGYPVIIVGQSEVIQFVDGSEIARSFSNRCRTKYAAGFRTLIFRSHYLLEKFWTKTYASQLRSVLFANKPDCVVVNYLGIAYALQKSEIGRLIRSGLVVETHNFDPQWFANIASRGGFFARIVGRATLQWLDNHLVDLLRNVSCIHVTQSDRAAYARMCTHESTVLQVGVDVPAVAPAAPKSSDVVLTFLGSLSVQMNIDALLLFESKYLPDLRLYRGGAVVVKVVGSNPSSDVMKLCSRNGWNLYADVSDQELSDHLLDSDFLIMPFAYSAGAKLKIAKALAHGLPLLATECVNHDELKLPTSCLFDDSPARWLSHVNAFRRSVRASDDFETLRRIAMRSSWSEMVPEVLDAVSSACQAKGAE
ncbi:MAG: glycosyl transferase group 1 [Ramlibacter sp.]|nr:glycosyl transferase group 1 [Ramlibacter sp.]